MSLTQVYKKLKKKSASLVFILKFSNQLKTLQYFLFENYEDYHPCLLEEIPAPSAPASHQS